MIKDKIFLFTTSYFDNKVECKDLVDLKRLIHSNNLYNIRIQIGEYRLLLRASLNCGKTRQIEGYSDLYLTYKYFNNIIEDKLSQKGYYS